MDLLKIIAIAIISVVAIVVLKPIRPELALVLSVGSAVLIILMVADELFEVVYSFYSIAESANINGGIFTNILKIIGVGYIAEFGNGICEDSGCKNIGSKIIFAGQITIMVLALPIINTLVKIIVEIIP